MPVRPGHGLRKRKGLQAYCSRRLGLDTLNPECSLTRSTVPYVKCYWARLCKHNATSHRDVACLGIAWVQFLSNWFCVTTWRSRGQTFPVFNVLINATLDDFLLSVLRQWCRITLRFDVALCVHLPKHQRQGGDVGGGWSGGVGWWVEWRGWGGGGGGWAVEAVQGGSGKKTDHSKKEGAHGMSKEQFTRCQCGDTKIVTGPYWGTSRRGLTSRCVSESAHEAYRGHKVLQLCISNFCKSLQ